MFQSKKSKNVRKHLLVISSFVFLVFAFSCAATSNLYSSGKQDINDYVIAAAKSYKKNGTHKYFWPRNGESAYDGCTTDVVFMNKKVMAGESESRTFCCGFTLEVFYKALAQYMKDNNLEKAGKYKPEESDKFKTLWFVRKTNGDGPGDALVEYGLGKRIENFDDAKRGDFVQIWRHSGSGHSVILWDIGRDEKGNITDITYLSTQPGTDGIGLNSEPVGLPKGIILEKSFISRVLPAEKWAK